VVEATRHLEGAAVAVGDGEWWASQKEFTSGTLGKFQYELRLKGTGLGDTHAQYLASRFSMSVALLVSTFTEMGEGVDPVMLYKFYELSDVTRPFENIALLHPPEFPFFQIIFSFSQYKSLRDLSNIMLTFLTPA
jgi:hypothetical protein